MSAVARGLYGRLWRWHFFAALIVIPFVLWQGVTGTLYLWSEWWMDEAYPELRFVKPQREALPVSMQIGEALRFVDARVGAGLIRPEWHAAHGIAGEAGAASLSMGGARDPGLGVPTPSPAAAGDTGKADPAIGNDGAARASPSSLAAPGRAANRSPLPGAADVASPPPIAPRHSGAYTEPSSTAAAGHSHHGLSGPSPHSGLAVQRVLLPDDPTRSTAVLFQSGGDGLPFPVFVDPYTGTVLGQLSAVAWLPGISRALHGGWPLGDPGSWLLELGDGWAILMIATGLYLWWPSGRGAAALWPRMGAGTRVMLHDLHSCVAVWFSVVFLFFLISALPWTAFWGGKVLRTIETNTGQSSPTGFSPGGASIAQFSNAAQPIEQAAAAARRGGVHGTLDIRLAPWSGAPLFMTNTGVLPSQDRTIVADAAGGGIRGDYTNGDLPVIPRLVALGIHVHQADFGTINVWLNTLFASSLLWLSATGVLSWWNRRPAGKVGAPPKVKSDLPVVVRTIVTAACVLMPLFGASVLLIALGETIFRSAQTPAEL